MLIHLLILIALGSVVTMVLVLMCCAVGARADAAAEPELVERAIEVVPALGVDVARARSATVSRDNR